MFNVRADLSIFDRNTQYIAVIRAEIHIIVYFQLIKNRLELNDDKNSCIHVCSFMNTSLPRALLRAV